MAEQLGAYKVIDADGHVLEPVDDWDALAHGQPGDPASSSTLLGSYIDPAFRDQLPVLFVDADGRTRLRVGDKILSGAANLGNGGMVGGSRLGKAPKDTRFTEGREGGFDPVARIADLDLDGIDAAVLYPTLGLLMGGLDDPVVAGAIARAYNRWITTEYCAAYPDRLIPAALLPVQSIELMVEEMRYAREHLQMRSAFLRPNGATEDLLLSDPPYDVVWETARELDMAIGIHEANGGLPAVGVDRVRDYGARHIVSHALEMMIACLQIIWGGVCERYPDVRFAFLESGGGWVPSWLDRMDRHFSEKGFVEDDSPLRLLPSEYFKRQCWVSLEPTEKTLPSVAAYLGPDRILWATDYPHFDGFFPGAPKTIADMLPSDVRPQVLGQGAINFYKL